MSWRLVKKIETNGAMQMAIDEAMLEARARDLISNSLRFFTWKPSCVTIGYFQDPKQELDLEEMSKRKIDFVRRYTGGGAVFHDKEITYTIVLKEQDVSYDIIKSYEEICDALILGLKKLGIKAEFKPINDIVVGGKKISGNAQTRKSGVVLQHGTLLIDIDSEKMFSILKVPDEKIKDKIISDIKQRVTSLAEFSKNFSESEIISALIYGFEKKFKTKFEEKELTNFEKKIADKLFKEKYSTYKWNYLRDES